MERGHSSNFPIEDLPNLMIMKVLSKVGKVSREDLKNCVLASKVLAEHANSLEVFQNLNLNDIVASPLLAVDNYKELMKNCLKHSNPAAHYIKGLLEYFRNNNTSEGLLNLQTAADGSSPIPEAVYLFGVINLCLGNTELGKEYMNKLRSPNDNTKGEVCWRNIKRSLHGIGIAVTQQYLDSLWAMTPPYVCNLNDTETTCDTCYHYKQMVKFVFTI